MNMGNFSHFKRFFISSCKNFMQKLTLNVNVIVLNFASIKLSASLTTPPPPTSLLYHATTCFFSKNQLTARRSGQHDVRLDNIHTCKNNNMFS